MSARFLAAFAVACMLALMPNEPRAEPAGHITGVGGIFFKSKDPKALTAWYRDVLGLKIETWGGAARPCRPMRPDIRPSWCGARSPQPQIIWRPRLASSW